MDAITSSGNYLGTDRIGRPLTDAESKALGALLRKHRFTSATLVAVRFAWKKTGSEQAAQDLMGRVWVRFIRWGWDPARVGPS